MKDDNSLPGVYYTCASARLLRINAVRNRMFQRLRDFLMIHLQRVNLILRSLLLGNLLLNILTLIVIGNTLY